MIENVRKPDPKGEAKALRESGVWSLFDPLEKTSDYHFYDNDLVTAINVAMAAERPLLLSGEPGVGKSSVAEAVARVKGWASLSTTITSRMTADDLKFRFDALRRLNDAQAKTLHDQINAYVTPGVLWEALNPKTAAQFKEDSVEKSSGRTLRIDEIDKGDLDFANDLLDAFDQRDQPFDISLPDGSKQEIRYDGAPLFILITSNGSKELPEPFLRRCIKYRLPNPDADQALKIVNAKFGAKKIKAAFDKDDDLKEFIAGMKSSRDGTILTALLIDGLTAMLSMAKMGKIDAFGLKNLIYAVNRPSVQQDTNA